MPSSTKPGLIPTHQLTVRHANLFTGLRSRNQTELLLPKSDNGYPPYGESYGMRASLVACHLPHHINIGGTVARKYQLLASWVPRRLRLKILYPCHLSMNQDLSHSRAVHQKKSMLVTGLYKLHIATLLRSELGCASIKKALYRSASL